MAVARGKGDRRWVEADKGGQMGICVTVSTIKIKEKIEYSRAFLVLAFYSWTLKGAPSSFFKVRFSPGAKKL